MEIKVKVSRGFTKSQRTGEHFTDIQVLEEEASFYQELSDRLDCSSREAHFYNLARIDEFAAEESHLHIWAPSQAGVDAGEAMALQFIINIVMTRSVTMEIEVAALA